MPTRVLVTVAQRLDQAQRDQVEEENRAEAEQGARRGCGGREASVRVALGVREGAQRLRRAARGGATTPEERAEWRDDCTSTNGVA